MFSLTDVLHFFPNEFTGPRRWRKPFAFVLAGPFSYIVFGITREFRRNGLIWMPANALGNALCSPRVRKLNGAVTGDNKTTHAC